MERHRRRGTLDADHGGCPDLGARGGVKMAAPSVAPLRQTLQELALNLWWAWQPDVQDLFCSIDPAGWEATGHNPIALLRQLGDDALAEADRRLSIGTQAIDA